MKFRDINLNADTRACETPNGAYPLSRKEFEVMAYLVAHQGRMCTRQELVDNIWDGRVDPRSVDCLISRVRLRLGNYGTYITTTPGEGYGTV